MIKSKLKANNFNRGQLFRPYGSRQHGVASYMKKSAFSFVVLCPGPLHHYVKLSSIFWGRRSFQIHMLLIFSHDFPTGQFVSVRSFLIAAMTSYSGFFLLSLVTRFA